MPSPRPGLCRRQAPEYGNTARSRFGAPSKHIIISSGTRTSDDCFPKYPNPQLIPDATRIVPRRALRFEDDTGNDIARDGEAGGIGLERKEVDDLYAKLKIRSTRLKRKRVPQPSKESLSDKRCKLLAEGGKLATGLERSEPASQLTCTHSPWENH